MKRISSLLLSLWVLGCAPSVYYVTPSEWKNPSSVDSVIKSFQPFLQGKRIFLDPGHGGEDRRNQGPEGDAVEADVNLRVSLALREYLLKAGATVFISRTRDESVPLVERPVLAANADADIFVSVHHNATGDPGANYSSTFYHAYPGHPDYHPSNHDLARYIQRDMSYAMRNAGPPFSPTFDGTLSDFTIFPNSGFAVLRRNSLPAVLIEGSFFTHPHEEQRLAREEFNRIEAWGIFLGLGRYFRAGIPELMVISDSVGTTPRPSVMVKVSSATGVEEMSTIGIINGKKAKTAYNDSSKTVTLSPVEELTSGYHDFSVWVRNLAGNASWPLKGRLLVNLPPETLSISLHPKELPLVNAALARITCRVLDANGMPVIDGTRVTIRINPSGQDTVLFTQNGIATFYVPGQTFREARVIEASAGSVSETQTLPYSTQPGTFLTGVVSSAKDSTRIVGARIRQVVASYVDSTILLDTTWSDGRYISFRRLPDPLSLLISHPGYFSLNNQLTHSTEPIAFDAAMIPVAGGRLFGKTFVIDPRYGGTESGDVSTSGLRAADINLTVAKRLHELLRAAGANVHLMRSVDTTIAESVRAKESSGYPRGMYVRIDASGTDDAASSEIYMNIPNTRFSRHLLGGLAIGADLDTAGIVGSHQRFYYDVAMGTITVVIPSVKTGRYDAMQPHRIDELAWGLFLGILRSEGFDLRVDQTFEVRSEDGKELFPGAEVVLSETFSAIADYEGRVRFFGLEGEAAGLRVVGHPAATVIRRMQP